MPKKGFISIHEQMLEWEWYHDTNVVRLFLHLLLTANYRDRRFAGMVVKRGQLVTGRKVLAEQTGLSEKQIRTALDKMLSTGEVAKERANGFTLLTIVKYDEYQIEAPIGAKERANEGPHKKIVYNNPVRDRDISYSNSNHTDSSYQNNSYLTAKKDSRLDSSVVKNHAPVPNSENAFEDFWKVYPTNGRGKGSKKVARNKFQKIVTTKQASLDELAKGVADYAKYLQQTGELNKDASTWLNQECWKDYRDDIRPGGRQSGGGAYAALGTAAEIIRRRDEQNRAGEQDHQAAWDLLCGPEEGQ